eukprot:4279023-Amphidinium_carterae.1
MSEPKIVPPPPPQKLPRTKKERNRDHPKYQHNQYFEPPIPEVIAFLDVWLWSFDGGGGGSSAGAHQFNLAMG